MGRIGGAFESFGLEVFRQNSLVRSHWVWFQSFEVLIGFNSLDLIGVFGCSICPTSAFGSTLFWG